MNLRGIWAACLLVIVLAASLATLSGHSAVEMAAAGAAFTATIILLFFTIAAFVFPHR